jgi:hypothetical protein
VGVRDEERWRRKVAATTETGAPNATATRELTAEFAEGTEAEGGMSYSAVYFWRLFPA